jgi:aminopeptidase-like protein
MAILDHSNKIEEQLLSLLPRDEEVTFLLDELWPICRSITGPGFDESLEIIKKYLPLKLDQYPSGSWVYDWQIPDVWSIKNAWVANSKGEKVIDFKKNNLHVINYSTPVNQKMTLQELLPYLHSLPEQPDAIPYLTTYYSKRWGFCLAHNEKLKLKEDIYHVIVDSELKPGNLTTASLVLPATIKTDKEIFLSTYLCHPSMANNELSGPLVMTFLHRALEALPERNFNVRFAIVPETIGSIAYLSKYGEEMKRNCVAGLVLTCCGDINKLTYKRSREKNILNDIVEIVLQKTKQTYKVLDFFPTGSDERQYSSPGFNLPMGSLMRSMYSDYPEYHTSLDDRNFISPQGIKETIYLYLQVIVSLMENKIYVSKIQNGEPRLGPRGLYPQLGGAKETREKVEKMMWVLNFADGKHSLLDISQRSGCKLLDLAEVAQNLKAHSLLE